MPAVLAFADNSSHDNYPNPKVINGNPAESPALDDLFERLLFLRRVPCPHACEASHQFQFGAARLALFPQLYLSSTRTYSGSEKVGFERTHYGEQSMVNKAG